ncbi:MAG: histone deacetylase [Candidatus Heimdallarchaeota archaeon]|nr:histone deacetylase [Candidatus Heimdallarchaeota archaeon]MCK4878988.1 histone deacetylase [Candidatus Heimdallarchaeota archaeon]
MVDLAVIFSELFRKHEMDRAHPESPDRVEFIMQGIKELQNELEEEIIIHQAETIDDEDILAVHVPDLLSTMQAISEAGGGMITVDTTLNEHTFDLAKLAAGATKQAAKLVAENQANKSFAVVRPPGHHAESNSAGGFCFFNNIAIAAEWLINNKDYNKILIIDIDHHFGNGTSHIFYHRKDVLYVSIHAHPMYSYPSSGYPTEVGIVDGLGYNVNIPLLPGTQSLDWLHALQFASGIINQYQPELILVSVGFDALRGDPVGILNLDSNAFFGAGYLLNELAKDHCEGKIICTLEGGYKKDQLKEVSKKFIKGLLGCKPAIIDKLDEYDATDYTKSILNQVKKAQKEYWEF